MTPRRVLAGWLVFSLGSLILFGILVTEVLNGQSLLQAIQDEWTYHLMFVGLFTVGALTVAHRPENRVSWLFAATGLLLGIGEMTSEFTEYAYLQAARPAFLATVAAWVSHWVWVPGFGVLVTLLLLWFPTGRPPSPRWRWVGRAAVATIVPLTLLVAFAKDPAATSTISNPLAIGWVTVVANRIFLVIGPLVSTIALACAASLVARFRSAGGEERQQLKWFMLAAAFTALFMIVDTAVVNFGLRWIPAIQQILQALAFAGLPVAAGIAIFKYRLYDIDVIINRTLVYGALTAILASCYFGLVVAFQRLLRPVTEQSDLAVAASTLAVAALFGPVRRRVQGFIDRRFYRSRYDAQRTLQTFSARLRDEVDLDHLHSELLHVVSTTMQPRHASLWLKPGQAR